MAIDATCRPNCDTSNVNLSEVETAPCQTCGDGTGGVGDPVTIDSSCEAPVFVEICNPETQPVQVISETEQLGCVTDPATGGVTGRVFFVPTFDADGNMIDNRMMTVGTDGTVTDPYLGAWEECPGDDGNDYEIEVGCVTNGTTQTSVAIVYAVDEAGGTTRHSIVNADGTAYALQAGDQLTLGVCPVLQRTCVKSEQPDTQFFANIAQALEDQNIPSGGPDIPVTVPIDGPVDGLNAVVTPVEGPNVSWRRNTNGYTGLFMQGGGQASVSFELPSSCEGISNPRAQRLYFDDLDPGEVVGFDVAPTSWHPSLEQVPGQPTQIRGTVAEEQGQWVEWEDFRETVTVTRIGGGTLAVVLVSMSVQADAVAIYTGVTQPDGCTIRYFDYQCNELTDPSLISRLRPCEESICGGGAGGGDVVVTNPVELVRGGSCALPMFVEACVAAPAQLQTAVFAVTEGEFTVLPEGNLVSWSVNSLAGELNTVQLNGGAVLELSSGETLSSSGSVEQGATLSDTVAVTAGTGGNLRITTLRRL